MRKYFECSFDILYLAFIFVSGTVLLLLSDGSPSALLFGCMALLLGFGDVFHLVPRMILLITDRKNSITMGLGKLITSLTSTLYYLLLYYAWIKQFPAVSNNTMTIVIWGLVLLRIALCCLPQNNWFGEKAADAWGIYRNIPFFILGLVLTVLFIRTNFLFSGNPLRFVPLGVFLSFLFYSPIVIWGEKYPALGMLMMPKTLAYVWIQIMALLLFV